MTAVLTQTRLVLLLLPLLAVGAASAVRAQNNPPDQALPDLAPRELEIRGQLEIQFPSLQRQPLVGFNPPPRIAVIPEGRQPFVEVYKQESADLPPSPLQRPNPPVVSALAGGPPNRGEVALGSGRYLSRFGHAHFGGQASSRTAVFGAFDYRGSDGDVPFDTQPTLKNPFDAMEASLGLKTTAGPVAAGATVDGFLDTYTLYGLERAVPLDPPTRLGKGAGLAAWVAQAATDYRYGLDVRFGQSRFDTDGTQGPAPLPERFFREQRLDVAANGAVQLLDGEGFLRAKAGLSGLDGNGVIDYTVRSLDAGGGYRFQTVSGYTLTVGLRYLTFDADRQTQTGVGDFGRRGNYISPELRLDAYPYPGVTVYARNSPGLDHHALSALTRHNPYMVDAVTVQPTVRVVDAEGGVRYFSGALQLGARAGYQQMPNYLFFEAARSFESNGFTRGFSTPRYGEARILHLGGEASVALASELHATVSATVRDGTLFYTVDDNGVETEVESDIPFYPTFVSEAMLAYAFAQQRGLIQVTGTYRGARYINRDAAAEVPAYFDLGFDASFDVTSAVGLILRGEHLLTSTLERWERYPLTTQVIMGGFRVRW